MKYRVVSVLKDNRPRFLIISDIEEIEILPSKYLKHLDQINASPNTVKSAAFALSYYYNYLQKQTIGLDEITLLSYSEQNKHFIDFLYWVKSGKHTEHNTQTSNKTCNMYLGAVFRYYQFLALEDVLPTIISAKLAKRIIAKISELVGSSIEEKVKGHIETKRTELFIKNYQKKLEEELLEDYGNEIIYDELWDILSQDKNIEKLLERCYNLASDDKLTDEEFVNDIMKSFKISIYNRESIKRILIQISKKAFESFNELRDPENIKLKNCGKITIKSDQIQIEQGSIEDLIKQKYIALMYHYQKIEVLNVELPIANFLRIVHFSDDIEPMSVLI